MDRMRLLILFISQNVSGRHKMVLTCDILSKLLYFEFISLCVYSFLIIILTKMFRSLCLLSVAATAFSQNEPLDVEEPVHVIQEWCSTANDCLASRPATAPAGITCEQGRCICGNPYELFQNAICKLPNDPDPVVTVVVELTWDNLQCNALPAGFVETLRADLRLIYGATVQVDLRTKCGSVVILAVVDGVAITVASGVNINTAMSTSGTVTLVGPLSKIDTYSGRGACAIGVGHAVVLSIGGLCQPIQCLPGYTLNSGSSVNEVDICEVVTVVDSDDELGGGAIAAIVVGVIGFVIILVLVIYMMCVQKNDAEEFQNEEEVENKNAPDLD